MTEPKKKGSSKYTGKKPQYTKKELDDARVATPHKKTGMTYESVGARRKRLKK